MCRWAMNDKLRDRKKEFESAPGSRPFKEEDGGFWPLSELEPDDPRFMTKEEAALEKDDGSHGEYCCEQLYCSCGFGCVE